ncbi:Hypothetical protein SCLAV_2267 [Streptomyces clavuligerus]|uniref:Uncharacterized protein n=1 Tax=Streptomyces clavuligerus TaxID=1901 RepID=E2Q7D4_STRCL|nr:Hypothetical protein SCLAV_2267 [Streptomyces clavuligerus]
MRQPLSQRLELNPFDFGPCACPRPDCKLKKKPRADGPKPPVPVALDEGDDRRPASHGPLSDEILRLPRLTEAPHPGGPSARGGGCRVVPGRDRRRITRAWTSDLGLPALRSRARRPPHPAPDG